MLLQREGLGKQARIAPEPEPNTRAQNETDMNADTCYIGQNCIPLSYTNRFADVYPYNNTYAPIKNVPIVIAATAYDHTNRNIYILVFNESLYYGTKMKHTLINPNQICHCRLDSFITMHVMMNSTWK